MTDTSTSEIDTGIRDVVYTTFMLRVREAMRRVDPQGLRLRLSLPLPVAEATDEWFYLRCRSEQMIAEANCMLPLPVLDLEDEYGTDQLAFVVRCGPRSSRISLGQNARTAWVELKRSYDPIDGRVKPEDSESVEDLVIELLGDEVRPGERTAAGSR